MDLYLVRHAIAEQRDASRWPDDANRPLTPEGERAFGKNAARLSRFAPAPELVLSSPFVRAWRTAEILSEAAGWQKPAPFEPLEADRPTPALLEALAPYAGRTSVALVGHEPGLSELAWLLLAGKPKDSVVRFKKGGVALLSAPGAPKPGGAALRWLVTPRVLAKR
jgi:phosphohistidine phosphatase